MARPRISRRDLPSGFPLLKYSSCAPGGGHPLEGRVGDVVADDVVHGDLGPAVDLDVLDQAAVLLRQVLGEGIRRLVHVVVGVEDREIELA